MLSCVSCQFLYLDGIETEVKWSKTEIFLFAKYSLGQLAVFVFSDESLSRDCNIGGWYRSNSKINNCFCLIQQVCLLNRKNDPLMINGIVACHQHFI